MCETHTETEEEDDCKDFLTLNYEPGDTQQCSLTWENANLLLLKDADSGFFDEYTDYEVYNIDLDVSLFDDPYAIHINDRNGEAISYNEFCDDLSFNWSFDEQNV